MHTFFIDKNNNDFTTQLDNFTQKQLLFSPTWINKFNDQLHWEQWQHEYNVKHSQRNKSGYGPGAIIVPI